MASLKGGLMHKIYLVSPYIDHKYTSPHLSLEYIKFYLMDHGYQAEIIDCVYCKDLDDVISKLNEGENPIIGVTAYTRERFHAYAIIRKIRLEIPDSHIVVGGRHFSCLSEETLMNLPEVDIVVRGEGEITFKEICDSVYRNTDFNKILGISFRSGTEIVHNPDRPLESNIDKFRYFDKNFLPDPKRYILAGTFQRMANFEMKFFEVMTTRGCPNSCVFCSLKSNKARYRSIDNIIKEIEEKIEITGVRNVKFIDPSLTISKNYVVELCDRIIEKKLNIKWDCYSRVDVDIELLKVMKKSGLIGVEVALESGSPRVLKAIKKKISLAQVERFCEAAYSLGIRLHVFCMISLPNEKIEDVDMTISMIRKLSKYIYSLSGLQATRILPDALIYNIAKERNILPSDFSWFEPYENQIDPRISSGYYKNVPLYLEHLTTEDILRKIGEFESFTRTEMASFYSFKRALKRNLKIDSIKKMSLRDIRDKAYKAYIMIGTAYRNKQKEQFLKFYD
jgi:magnesium-protoporphyrin IX monomethyl ester (oxidative) cyclase